MRPRSANEWRVYQAMDRKTDRVVAVKILNVKSVTDVGRFDSEATLLQELRHPGIVRYVDHGLTSHGFPNCFFLGRSQSALTVSVPMALNEQAKHVTYMITQARSRGHNIVEPTVAPELERLLVMAVECFEGSLQFDWQTQWVEDRRLAAPLLGHL